MPIIVEDGTLPENANSYVSLEQADAYLVPRNLWPAYEVEKPIEPEGSQEPDNPELPDGEDEGEKGIEDEGVETQAEDNGETETPENTGGNETDTESPDVEPEEPEKELPDTTKPDDNPEIAKKEASLMRAFDYLNGTLQWKGNKVDWQRMIAWPRENVPVPGCNSKKPVYIENDVIPEAVCRAQMELAAFIYNGYDIFAPLEKGGKIKSKSDSKTESVDVLSESESHSVTYLDNAPIDAWFPSIYPLLKPFLEVVPGEARSGFSVHDILRG